MDATVSARVPVAVKAEGNALLSELGATPSQLINAAYRYVLAERRLPEPRGTLERQQGQHRQLSAGQQARIARSLRAMYVGDRSPAAEAPSFKQQLNQARDDRYARFA